MKFSAQNWYLIVNPVSGKGKGKRRVKEVERLLKKADIAYQVSISQTAFQEKMLFDQAVEAGFRHFILIGGDGTYHSVINSYMRQPEAIRQEICFAMIAAGTGNDWCRTFLDSAKPDQVIRWLEQDKTLVQDIGWATYMEHGKQEKRFFLNVAGMGFDAYVAKNYLAENPSNSLVYLKGLLKGLLGYESPQATIKFDEDTIDASVFILAAGQGKYFGGGMKITPRSDPADGLLDLTLVQGISSLRVISLLPALYAGNFYDKIDKITHHRSKVVEVTSTIPIYLQLDGETLGHTPAQFGLIPQALRVIGKIAS